MKLNFDSDLGATRTYSAASLEGCPPIVADLLKIKELLSVFVCGDFITLNKDPRCDWQPLLERATALTGDLLVSSPISHERKAAEVEGQVHAFVQTFKGIPIQVKIVDSLGEERISLGARFNEVASSIQTETGANFLAERYWADHGLRYGTRTEVAQELSEEIQGMFEDQALERAKSKALGKIESTSTISLETLQTWLQHQDWHKRLNAILELSATVESIPLLAKGLMDVHPQVRRMSAAALGATGSTDAVKFLCDALINDDSPGVRRTAGDALSDIGDVSSQEVVCQALTDSNKLVRWRAARFLFDLGTNIALPYLEKAAADSEFEVRLEIEAAKQRISEGSKGLGPAWKRIIEQS